MRVRDAGLMKSDFEDKLKAYTYQGLADRLGHRRDRSLLGQTWALAAENLRSLDRGVHSHFV